MQKIAVSTEKTYLVSKSFTSPPLPERSLLPGLAYKNPSRLKSKENKESILLLNETEEVDNDCSDLLENLLALKESKSSSQISKTNSKLVNLNNSETKNLSTNPFNLEIQNKVRNEVTCWNCNQVGHRFQDCSEPSVIFCKGCGKKEVIRPTCPTYSKN